MLSYPQVLWMQFCSRQTMLMLIRGVEYAFAMFGGVPAEALFPQIKAVIIDDQYVDENNDAADLNTQMSVQRYDAAKHHARGSGRPACSKDCCPSMTFIRHAPVSQCHGKPAAVASHRTSPTLFSQNRGPNQSTTDLIVPKTPSNARSDQVATTFRSDSSIAALRPKLRPMGGIF
jgi:hypothetical protein